MAEAATKMLQTMQIVPDVLSTAVTLPKRMGIQYGPGAAPYGLDGACSELKPATVVNQPHSVTLEEPDADKHYTLIMTDPDVPARDYHPFREFIHWVVVDCPGADISAGKALFSYVGAGPPHSSGLHRYVFMWFEQSKKDIFDEAKAAAVLPEGRGGAKAAAFAEKHGLGAPLAAAVFEAQWDESVDALHEGIGFVPPPQYRSPAQKAKHGDA
eukprot:CAMPEP_0114547628 /NCGR_PEP_ID=MMETSP0114-20121206/4561_1 /TAXON_ID=31324 /ORGANISM="Goniomonas sp, Strain m" /LENGTH=212 /DNA_ID=CAMNT_0001732187 /DNA_START=18 /DNA_END=656 /DNA_ORIENTATION=-